MKEGSKIVIIGAGPAGLGCAYELTSGNSGKNLLILEKNSIPGGLSRTTNHKGHLFDIGPHRFYTKNSEVLALWKKVAGKEFIQVNRLTRIYYNNKFFLYPVQFKDILLKLGLRENILSGFSFLRAKVFLRKSEPKTFEDWITKNFGHKLFRVFFKTYTEKVWGISCQKIGAEWAAQRIKNLSFSEALKTAIIGQRTRKAKSLVGSFHYPQRGAGQLYQKLADQICRKGATLSNSSKVTKIIHKNKKVIAIEYEKLGKKYRVAVGHLFSSMPLTELVVALSPRPDPAILSAARKLYFRDHITVNLVINQKNLFPDNWIYIHDPKVKMARVANFGNFSKKMLKNKNQSCVCVEYFAFQNENIWKLSDRELIDLAKEELEKTSLVKSIDITEGFVVRETESYPTYYLGYEKYFNRIKDHLDSFTNLQVIGRGGMYKYNNMDHSIYSGILAARNLSSNSKQFNLWGINEDAEYLEEKG